MTALSPVIGCWPGRGFDANPFVAQFQAALEAAGCAVVDVCDPRRIGARIDVLHIHWPEQVFWAGGGPARLAWRTASTLAAVAARKARGMKVVWMVHNLRPHELQGARGPLWRVLGPAAARLADGFMTLSPATLAAVLGAFPALRGKPSACPWHPVPPVGPPVGRSAARRAEGLPPGALVFAFLGLIRPYKGVDALIAAFRAGAGAGRRLLIAGECKSAELRTRLLGLAEGDGRVTLALERQDEASFARKTAAADVIVLPFVDYLHSASIVHAVSHGLRVLTPRAPFADALALEVGPGWITTYAGALSPGMLDLPDAPAAPPDLSALGARPLGEAARALYETVLGRALIERPA